MRKSGGVRLESELAAKCRDELPVKLEIAEDDLEEEHGPLNKRSRVCFSLSLIFRLSDLFCFCDHLIAIRSFQAA